MLSRAPVGLNQSCQKKKRTETRERWRREVKENRGEMIKVDSLPASSPARRDAQTNSCYRLGLERERERESERDSSMC